jgi:proteasome assembly chaperone 3
MSSLLDTDQDGQDLSAKITHELAAQPPIQSFQLRRPILGVPTELLIQTFDDRILVIITQNGKVGCLVCPSYSLHPLILI